MDPELQPQRKICSAEVGGRETYRPVRLQRERVQGQGLPFSPTLDRCQPQMVPWRGLQVPEPAEVPAVCEAWVSVDQVASHLTCSIDGVYRWSTRRGLPGHRVGVWRFKVSEVDAWVRPDGANEHQEKLGD